MINNMAGAEHPLIAANGANTFANLVCERLKAEAIVSLRQSAGDGIVRAFVFLRLQEFGDGLRETPLQQIHIAAKWDISLCVRTGFTGQMKAMNRVEEKGSTNPLVKILTFASKFIQFLCLSEQLTQVQLFTTRIQREIAQRRILRSDDLDEFAGH